MEKHIIIVILYRPQGTDLNEFSDLLANILDRIKKESKICYILGDCNINLLNYDTHSGTAEFADLLYAPGHDDITAEALNLYVLNFSEGT